MGAPALRLVDGGDGPPVDPPPSPVAAFARGDHVELAARVLERLGPDPVTYDVGEVWQFRPPIGTWEQVPAHVVRNHVAAFAGAPCDVGDAGMIMIKANTARGVEEVLRDRLLSEPGRVAFAGAPPGMAFSNGFLVVQGGEASLRAHGPMNLARHRYEFSYRPYVAGAAVADGGAPMLEKFLGELFADVADATERAARVALLQEFAGACLVGDATRYQRYLVLFATGGNGKSELLRVFRSMFPAGTTASIEPQKWRDDKHAAALEGVRGNFVDELPDDEIMGSHSVKKIVTGEPVTARRVYRDTITFTPIAGHVFATNSPVQSTDYSDGFWERPLVLILSRKFRQSAERRLEAAKVIVDAELPAIVAWAVDGACRAQRQQGYTEPVSSRATLLEWRDDNDQVRGFVADGATPGRWAAAALYEKYREWAKTNGCAVMSAAKFGRRIVANSLASRDRDAHGRWYTVGSVGT